VCELAVPNVHDLGLPIVERLAVPLDRRLDQTDHMGVVGDDIVQVGGDLPETLCRPPLFDESVSPSDRLGRPDVPPFDIVRQGLRVIA
jgi:hypothetical protein